MKTKTIINKKIKIDRKKDCLIAKSVCCKELIRLNIQDTIYQSAETISKLIKKNKQLRIKEAKLTAKYVKLKLKGDSYAKQF